MCPMYEGRDGADSSKTLVSLWIQTHRGFHANAGALTLWDAPRVSTRALDNQNCWCHEILLNNKYATSYRCIFKKGCEKE